MGKNFNPDVCKVQPAELKISRKKNCPSLLFSYAEERFGAEAETDAFVKMRKKI